ncbi:hypothetical protein ACHAWU_006744 [Discostella pseudostelligera]|uniref:Uncharacterized protein n=1 Tax=Discostella pseudostelligera TaxID=259834 RepID=A0ABD3N957_9STRA
MLRHFPLILLTIAYCPATSAFTYRDISEKACREKTPHTTVTHASGEDDVSLSLPSLFWTKSSGNILRRRYCCLVLQATSGRSSDSDKGKDGGGKKGYRFGDITKSLIGGSVEKITGKPYEFGDLSRAIDSSVKEKINDLTGNDDYEFGDLSRWVDTKIKGEVNKFTNKEEYQFGDMTKEILRRVATGQYTLDDLFMLLKALAIFQASISPIAGFLPVKLLVQLLDYSLLNDVAGRVTSALALELDKRLKKSLLGDENYQLGDATKRTISNAVKAYTGKESYEFGDVTKRVMSSFAEDSKTAQGRQMVAFQSPNTMEALDDWDRLSEKDLKCGLDEIEKYVERIERDQRGETSNK